MEGVMELQIKLVDDFRGSYFPQLVPELAGKTIKVALKLVHVLNENRLGITERYVLFEGDTPVFTHV